MGGSVSAAAVRALLLQPLLLLAVFAHYSFAHSHTHATPHFRARVVPIRERASNRHTIWWCDVFARGRSACAVYIM